ncbi:cation:proton antiporter [Parvularcula maris]|uniref:Cation:proton antiporter n=1 Tax=Parvularcula maris TaxID=2965077 RepID=A0A9X2L9I3_9PROT|nr:cation:proton antiporter [Parvularcula maris]MCQ8185575.1 cation:proton antiporter [Parvularcula maris]
MLDARDIFYFVVGAALFVLSLRPALAKLPWFNVPLFYVVVGVILAGAGAPVLDPRTGKLSAMVVEHASELIVIISLAGAGLAIDSPGTWKNWAAAYRLLLICMPLTIAAIAWAGSSLLGLPLAAAVLLAAALAPTDPVLAQSVQVGPPGKREDPMQISLTAEAGLNDGLAFPFVYLAITLALVAAGEKGGDWFASWLTIDLFYRVAAGLAVGWVVGWTLSKLIFSPVGDGRNGAWNSLLVVLAATLLSYGITEAVNGYGFLAVFMAARAGRANTRGTEMEGYERFAHHGAEQLESILLVLILLWFGMFVGSGGLEGATWMEIGVALAIVLVVRPAAGALALLFYDCPRVDRSKIAFFGIRGMGSIFYIAYAQNHAPFAEIDNVWRIAGITILISMVVHGFTANFTLDREGGDEEEHPAMNAVKEDMANEKKAA